MNQEYQRSHGNTPTHEARQVGYTSHSSWETRYFSAMWTADVIAKGCWRKAKKP